MKYLFFYIIFISLQPGRLCAQFNSYLSTIELGDSCFQLTGLTSYTAGVIWSTEKIDLTENLDIRFSVMLGCSNGGADGICFVFKQDSADISGNSGGYLAYGSYAPYDPVSPSVAIEFDTWNNDIFGDISDDHAAIMQNGSVDHGSSDNLAGPVEILSGGDDIEDCEYHNFNISWNAASQNLILFDDSCNEIISYTGDIVSDVFGGDALVYYGFTSATGATVNEHYVCILPPYTLEDYIPLNDTTIACGDTIQLFVDSLYTSVWSPPIYISDINSTSPFIWPDVTTTYTVTLTDACGSVFYDTVDINVLTPENISTDTIICEGDILTIDVAEPGASYLWYDGSTLSSHDFSIAGTYWVIVNSGACSYTDTINLTTVATIPLELGNDTSFCAGTNFIIDAGPGFSGYLWSNGSTTQTITPIVEGVYWVNVMDSCGNILSDTIFISDIYSLPPLNFPDTIIFCQGDFITVDAGSGYATYLWFDGSTEQSNIISEAGDFWITITDVNGCTASDTIYIPELYPQPYINLGADTSMCLNDVIILNAYNDNSTYLWQDGSQLSTYAADEPGIYSVNVINQFGCIASDEITIIESCGNGIYIPNAFTPNGDGINEIFKPVIAVNVSDYKLQVWSQWGILLFQTNEISAGWDGTFQGKNQEMDAYVYVISYTDSENTQRSYSGTITLLR